MRKVAGGSLDDELPKSVARVTPRAARRRDPRPPGRRATALPLVAHRPYASGHTWFPEWGFRGKLQESTTGPAPFEQGGGSEAGDRPSPGRKVAEMGGERAAYDATSAVDGRALWRRVVSVAEGRARVRSRRAPFAIGHGVPVRAVHREFTAPVRELSCGLRTVGDRKGRCSPRSERQLRSPPHRGVARARLSARLTCRRFASEGASATRPVAAAYVGSAPTCGADPCEKEHST